MGSVGMATPLIVMCFVAIALAVSIQDRGAVPCTTDACCLAMYKASVHSMSWCIADVVVAESGHGCRIVPRCSSKERCVASTRECTALPLPSHVSAAVATCDPLACNLCNGQACNITTDTCEQVGAPVVCGEGTRCSPVSHQCVATPCESDTDCTGDTIFCNGAPRCNFNTNSCEIMPACPRQDAPLCSETLRQCNAICVSDADCMLPEQEFCDMVRTCDAKDDWCRQAAPRCNAVTETCDPLNRVCVPLGPVPSSRPSTPSLVDGNALFKWVLIIWLFTFLCVILCCIVVWLARQSIPAVAGAKKI